MRIVLLGPPGTEKGTQAKSISNRYSIPHISTEDIFRKNISESTPLGIEARLYMDNGQLVPGEVTINMVKDRLQQDDCENGYLLGSSLRTVHRAETLDNSLTEREESIDTALLIEILKESILGRMIGRGVCPSCGAGYRIKFSPPTNGGKCDLCGSDIIQRKDDTEETVKERLGMYKNQTQPLIDFYKNKERLSVADGTQAIGEVFESICKMLGSNK